MNLAMAMVLGVFAQGLGLAQAAPKPLEFEVASVKQVAAAPTGGQPGGAQSTGAGSMSEASDRITYRAVTLKRMLEKAYGVLPYQVGGPAWLDQEHYDVDATIPEGATKEQVPEMLKKLLVERFRIVLHSELKDEPAYLLRVGKDGLKLKPSASDQRESVGISSADEMGEMELTYRAQTMDHFADSLSRDLGRVVPNQTALDGRFDFSMHAESAGGFMPLASSLFAAVREVGLQLEAGKAPLQHIVIDQARKTPTPN